MRAALRAAGSLALIVVIAVAALATTPRTAHACSCVGGLEVSEYAEDVDVAFVGRQVSRDTYTVTLTFDEFETDIQLARMVLEVDWVYKGDLGPRVEIHSAFDSAACGVDFWHQLSPAVVATEHEGQLSAGACDYPLTVSELEEAFGTGYPPAGATDPRGSGESAAPPDTLPAFTQPDTSVEPQVPADTEPPPTPPTESAAPPDTLPAFTQPDTSVEPQVPADTEPPPTPPTESAQTEIAPGSRSAESDSRSSTSLIFALLAVVATAVLTIWVSARRRKARRLPPAA